MPAIYNIRVHVISCCLTSLLACSYYNNKVLLTYPPTRCVITVVTGRPRPGLPGQKGAAGLPGTGKPGPTGAKGNRGADSQPGRPGQLDLRGDGGRPGLLGPKGAHESDQSIDKQKFAKRLVQGVDGSA